MALTPTRSSNLRIAGWLMLTSIVIGLIGVVIGSVWEMKSAELSLPDFLTSVDEIFFIALLLLTGNLIALIAAIGILVSPTPARLKRALIYTAIGTAIEGGVVLLISINSLDGIQTFTVLFFHLLVTLPLALIFVRKTPLPTRLLILRAAIVSGAWALAITLIAVLTFPFTQYGTANSKTEAADIHQLRQLSNRLLAATRPELVGAKAAVLKAESLNQASISGTSNFDCTFNETTTHFNADFGAKAKFKTSVPQLVLKEEFQTKIGEDGQPIFPTTAPATDDDAYTPASLTASKAYWNGVKARIQQRMGELPDGWSPEYKVSDRLLVHFINKQEKLEGLMALSGTGDESASVYFSARTIGCYPLDKAPNGTR